MKRRVALLLACFLFALSVPFKSAFASGATDEIENFTINVSVNDDATLDMVYHLDWKVLKSDGIGPVTWVKIGMPNRSYLSYEALSDNIDKIILDGQYANVYFTKEYYQGEVISFDYKIVQDYMYEMNVLTEGETVYYFTPGWFDGIAVDELVINWNADKALSWSHGATVNGDVITWSGSLSEGAKFDEVSVTYSSDAWGFDASKTISKQQADSYNDYWSDNGYGNYDSASNDDGDAVIGFLFFVGIIVVFVKLVKKAGSYVTGSGFADTTTKKKITRTLIKYYPTCPGCGAARPENADKCEYCGRSFIESEEVIEEKDIKEPSKYSTEGTYSYGGSPNTYMRVHVTTVHVPRPVTPVSSSSHSSCAHSSCACAHSCACACACACAGGGRAGCSTKDFYNTNLKLKQLEMRTKAMEKANK